MTNRKTRDRSKQNKPKDVFDKFDVDINQLPDDRLQFLTKEMIETIIENCVESIDIQPEQRNHNYENRRIDFVFDSTETANKFEKQFGSKIFKQINKYLEDNHYDPAKFNRIITVSFDGQEKTRSLYY